MDRAERTGKPYEIEVGLIQLGTDRAWHLLRGIKILEWPGFGLTKGHYGHVAQHFAWWLMNDNINSRRIASWENLTLGGEDAS